MRTQLPSTGVIVPGPGPTEPKPERPPSPSPIDAPAPPSKSDSSAEASVTAASPLPESASPTEGSAITGASTNDPYSNLDGAFGSYLVDEPRPMTGTHQGRHGEDEDSLF